jgi:hypothetical protein
MKPSGQYSSKDRVKIALAREEPDRVPVDYEGNPGISRRLAGRLGISPDDEDLLLDTLDTDIRRLRVPYTGPDRHKAEPGARVNEWGVQTRRVEHASGGYWDYCGFPLAAADEEAVEKWPMPTADEYDYACIADLCRKYRGKCVIAGHPGIGDNINSAGMLRTMEQTLIDLITDNPAGLRLMDRKNAVQLAMMERILENGKDEIDILWIGEDLGTQHAPLISLELFRKHIRPRLQRFVDLGRAYHIPVMMHSCGSSSWAFQDFIDMGVSVVDTLQPEAKDMSPAHLKSTFGNRLSFRGCISTAGPLAVGNPEDTSRSVREILNIMMPGGGYILAPTHLIQDNTPTENVLALYRTARDHGSYR